METNTGPLQLNHEPIGSAEITRFRDDKARGRITQVLLAHGALRIASGANGILIGLYLASLRNGGGTQGAGLVGILSAVSFAAELVASIPMGLASDAISPRSLMTAGAAVGAVAALLFGLTHSTSIFSQVAPWRG